MPVISVAGRALTQDAPRAPKLPDMPLKSHLAHLDHAQEIRDHLSFIADLDKHIQFLRTPCHDPWEQADRQDQEEVDRLEVVLHVGAISAHIHYLAEARKFEQLTRLGMSMDPNVLRCVREICPGVLTGNWQYLARHTVPF